MLQYTEEVRISRDFQDAHQVFFAYKEMVKR